MSATTLVTQIRAASSTRVTATLRSSSALKIAPLMAALLVLYMTSTQVTDPLDGYWVGATAQVSTALPFIAPLCAAAAAWEIGRLRRAGVVEAPSVRTPAAIVARALAPVVLTGVAGLAVALLLVSGEVDAIAGGPDPALLLVCVIVLLGHVGIGAGVGRFVPAVVAAPAVAVGGYFELLYPRAMQTPWVRHLPGLVSDCCDAASRPARATIEAPIVLATGMAVAGILVAVARRRHRTLFAVAGVVLTACGAVAVVLVHGMSYSPVTARTSGLRCAGGNPRVCVWPEHADLLPAATAAAADVRRRLTGIGLTLPAVASESSRERWSFAISRKYTRATDLHAVIVAGLIPLPPDCVPGQPPRQVDPTANRTTGPGEGVLPYLHAWLDLRAGTSAAYLDQHYPPLVVRTVRSQTAKPLAAQVADFRANLAAVAACRNAVVPK